MSNLMPKAPKITVLTNGVVFLLFALVSWFYLIPVKTPVPPFVLEMGLAGSSKNPQLMMYIITTIIFAMSVMAIIDFALKYHKYNKVCLANGTEPFSVMRQIREFPAKYWDTDSKVLGIIGLFLVYSILMPLIGYIVTTLALAYAINIVLDVKGLFPRWGLPLVLVGAIYFSFTKLLFLSFPSGILF